MEQRARDGYVDAVLRSLTARPPQNAAEAATRFCVGVELNRRSCYIALQRVWGSHVS